MALWCARDVAHARLQTRNPSDVVERLQVWDDTPRLYDADLEIDTGQTTPAETVAIILRTALWTCPLCPLCPHNVLASMNAPSSGDTSYPDVSPRPTPARQTPFAARLKQRGISTCGAHLQVVSSARMWSPSRTRRHR